MSEYEDDVVLTDISKISEEIKLQSKKNHSKIILRSFFSIAIVSLIATYLFSPIGKVKINNLSGNYYLNKDDVISLCGLSKNDSILKVSVKKTMSKLNESPYVNRSSIDWHLTYLNVYVDEVAPIAKLEDGEILLTNGEIYSTYQKKYSSYTIDNYNVDINSLPVFIDYKSDTQSKTLLNYLKFFDQELYNRLVKLDETMIILKEIPTPEKYLGLYFELDTDYILRVRINHKILKEALQNKEAFISAFRSPKEEYYYNKDNDIYEGVYYKVENEKKKDDYRIVTFEEVASDGQNN